MALKIVYKLDGPGWARCTVLADDAHAKLTASYLSDALGDLAKATVRLLNGSPLEHVSFEEEPGEYRWVLKQFATGRMVVRVLGFPDANESPDDSGSVLLQFTCATEEFAEAVRGALDAVLEEHGEHEYKRLWIEYPFPSEALRELESRVKSAS